MPAISEIVQRIEEVDTVKIFFTDLNGRLMSLPVSPEGIEKLFDGGVGFDGSSVAGIATVDDSDRLLVPMPESFRLVDFGDEKMGFLVGRIENSRRARSRSDPRAVLEKVVADAESRHHARFLMGPEHEFFLLTGKEFSDEIYSDKAGYYHSSPHDRGEAVRNGIIRVLAGAGVRHEKSHHEVSPSQHEINLECLPPLESADRTILFNHVAQKVAAQHGYHATFMPKPFDGQNRNAFHIHLSMQELDGRNTFYEDGAEHGLSATARQFIGGVLKYAREASILMASTVNSYKAYVADREAPIVRGWGIKNRSSMVRVPYADSPEKTRVELRCPDPLGNVYLQFAAFIGMGLRGIEEGLDCGEPDAGTAYKMQQTWRAWDERFLPKCMFEALAEAERSDFLKDLLGEQLYENYLRLKMEDWEEHRTHVTPREHRKYLS